MTEQTFDGRRLTRAVAAKETVALPSGDRQVQAAQAS